MPDRRIIILLAAATLTAGGALGGDGPSQQEAIAERGAKVMPFSLDATTHVFDPSTAGGTQRVVADDPRDREQISLIRPHLKKEATAFQRGSFADPAAIHGREMPGLAALKTGYRRIKVRYRNLPDGAQIAYRTAAPALAAAIGDWFGAQLRDHGSDAKAADRSTPPGHRR
jgi:hypothetical protein